MLNYKFSDDTKEAILKILEILKYPGDSSELCNQILEVIAAKTLDDLIKLLPKDQSDALVEEIKKEVSVDLINKIRDIFPERDLKDKFIENFKTITDEVLKSVLSTATEEQKLQVEEIKASVI